MQASNQELLNELPDSPYTKQLLRGFAWLRFSRDLEQQYRQHSRTVLGRPHRIAIVMALVIWLLFGVADNYRLELLTNFPDYSPTVWYLLLLRGTTLFAIVFAAILIFRNRPETRSPLVATALLLVIGQAAVLSVILYNLLGIPHSESALLLVIIACFFPLGLTFYQSLAVAMYLCLFSKFAGLLLDFVALEAYNRTVNMLVLALVVGAVGGYIREHAQREQFLLRHLLNWQASRDGLTGLHNRRSFNRHISTALRQAQRDKTRLALLMVDIDHFKPFNDHYGHQRGDSALLEVARILLPMARRPMDMAVRLGGEEFVLLLYDVDGYLMHDLAQQLRDTVNAANIPHVASPTATHLTISLGALLANPHETPESLYQRADALLYQAKQGGRNRVVLADGTN